MSENKPQPIAFPEQPFPGGGGNGGKFDDRLRAVEIGLAQIKTQMENVATKNDIARLKLWAVTAALIGSVTVLGTLVTWIVQWAMRNFPAGQSPVP